MIAATLDLAFQLPNAKPLDKPTAFTDSQLKRLAAWGTAPAVGSSPLTQQLLQRVAELRGTSVTWACGLSLGDLITWTVKIAHGSASALPAPISFFKPQGSLWIPKVVVRVCPEFQIDHEELAAYHMTCRRASIEFMSITDEQIEDGYLERKDFKRAFNGAFFCDRVHNTTIFCPTLRAWGFRSWTQSRDSHAGLL